MSSVAQQGAPAIAGTRVYRNHHLDSTRWDAVPYRPDDIVVTTPYKTGTTWTQRILAALLHGPERTPDRDLSPWVDARFWGPIEPIAEVAERQSHRRFLKTHLPLDGLPWHDDVSYVVVGRDLRDVFMSLLNHYAAYGDTAMSVLNDADRPGDEIPRFGGDPHEWWAQWIGRGWFEWERDGWPFWSAFHHLETWWAVRDRPNVLLVHYADLLAEPAVEIGRLAGFLGIDIDDDALADVVEVTSFDAMRRDFVAQEAAAGGPDGAFFEGGAKTFINKGTNGRWRDLLTPDELAQYEERAAALDPELRTWLETGRHGTRLSASRKSRRSRHGVRKN